MTTKRTEAQNRVRASKSLTTSSGGGRPAPAGAMRGGQLTAAPGGRKKKISVTVDEHLWAEVQSLVADDDAAATASAAAEQALSLWVAHLRLARALDEMYENEPGSRPADEDVARAAAVLGR